MPPSVSYIMFWCVAVAPFLCEAPPVISCSPPPRGLHFLCVIDVLPFPDEFWSPFPWGSRTHSYFFRGSGQCLKSHKGGGG